LSVPDVLAVEMLRAGKLVEIHFHLLLGDVISIHALPARRFKAATDETDSREKL
jgi:hypothetical protein